MCQGPQAVNGGWQMLLQANPLEADHIVPVLGSLMLLFIKKLKAGRNASFVTFWVVCESVLGGCTVKQMLKILAKKKDHGGPLFYSII